MRINYLSPQGVLEVEHAALRELEQNLPSAWGAFAAFRLLTRGSKNPLDVDLLLLTTNRILVVELKNWAGEIHYTDGQWIHKGAASKSPVDVTDNKVRALKGYLKDKLPANTKIPFIEGTVVLCHPHCVLKGFPDEQRRFVMTLNDFVKAGSDVGRYKKAFPDTPPGMYSRSANPLDLRTKYDLLFSNSNPAVLRRRTVFNGFEQVDDREDYKHPRKIWSEFRAQHQENQSSKALLRKWNFQELAQGGTSTLERHSIGLRELRLNETLRFQAPELHADLLEPIGSATADDITTNFVEGYRLPTGIERLGEHLVRNAAMSMQERRSLAKSILARFAKLHTLGIAHRDITSRTLWVIEPSRVILSTFAAARIPESQTVGVHRIELETGSIDLPEDDGVEGKPRTSDPFTRDVFLLGVLVFEMLEGKDLERVNRVPVYDANAPLAVPALGPWYAKSMDWEPTARYRTATEALDALNECLTVDSGPDVQEADFEVYKTEASPFNLPAKRFLSNFAGKMVYESERDGERVLVKCWQKLDFDTKYDARNLRLLAFLRQARSLRQSGFDAAPEVMDFGMGPFGLMLVTRWVDGATLPEWLATEPDARRRAQIALALLNCVRRLHVLGLSHGDIKALNVVVPAEQETDEARVVLVDIPDLSADGDEGMTVGMVPPALETASPQHRDAYAVCMLVLDLLSDEYGGTRDDVRRAVELTEALPPLDLLAETLQAELQPKPPLAPSFEAVLKKRNRPAGTVMDLVPNNGEFSVRVTRNRETGHLRFIVVGIRQSLTIKFDPEEQVVLDASVSNVEHHEYVHAYRTKSFSLNAALRVSFAENMDAAKLGDYLFQRYRTNASDETAADEALPGESMPVAGVDPYAGGGESSLKVISASALWTALANTDEMNVTAITVRSGVKQVPPESGNWLIPFDCEGGVFDFAEDETIELVERRIDPQEGIERWYKVATVHPDIGKDLMKAHALSMRFSPRDGSVYYVRGTLEKVASERRVAAMKRVLAGGALIPRMVDYFDPATARMPRQANDVGHLKLDEYELNATQEEALRTAISLGPVSLLQGPPGTGKTKFIASFVHLMLSKSLAGNILVVSQSHEAVNNVMEKVAGLVRSSSLDVAMVRIGLQSMVSPALRNIQEDAIRQSYREQFDAEAKERVRAVGKAMGLPKGYVHAATDLHTTLGGLLRRIEHLSHALGSESTDSSDEHIERLRKVFLELAGRLGVRVAASDDFGDALQSRLDDLAVEHGSPSPAKCERLGQIARLSTEFSKVLRSPHSNFTSYLARCSNVVAGTCVGVGKQRLGIVDVPYDWVIVDEAARASPMELVVAMQAGKRVLLVGDHLQLPPSYPREVEKQAAGQLGISRRDFRRMNNFQRAFSSTYGQTVGRTLRTQYRMAASINQLVSHCFYKDSLEVGREPPGEEYDGLPAFLSKQVVWVDTQDQGSGGFHRPTGSHEGALENETEAAAVVEVVRAIVGTESFMQHVARRDGEHEPVIGIIAMYAAQRDLIRRKLEQAEWAAGFRDRFTVGTVDSYQGKENRIIVLSVVRNNTEPTVGFLSEPERINVAMSRAKDRLVIVSSTAMWSDKAAMPMKLVLDEVINLESAGEAAFIPSKELKRSLANA